MNIANLINDYANWIKNEISIQKTGEYFAITTPYLDRHNDYLEIYVKQEKDGTIELTDDGNIIDDLEMSGVNILGTPKRKDMLNQILRKFSVTLSETTLRTRATEADFPLKKHLFVQAMLAVDDMFELRSENIKNFFVEDVENYFKANDILFSKDFSLLGKTGSLYTYDFHIQKTKEKRERFCKAINKLRQDTRNLTIFNWIDTKEKRNDDSELIVIINDEDGQRLSQSDTAAFKTYDITPVAFSKRNDYIDIFN